VQRGQIFGALASSHIDGNHRETARAALSQSLTQIMNRPTYARRAPAAPLGKGGNLGGPAAALRAVPATARAEVGLRLPVMRRPAGHVLHELPERSANPLCSDGTAAWQLENQPLSDDEAQDVGRLWYAVATEESQIAADVVL